MSKKVLVTILISLTLAAIAGSVVGLALMSGSRDDRPSMAAVEAEEPTPGPDAAATSTSGFPPRSGMLVAPDPDFEKALKNASFRTRGWKTDFSLHTVPSRVPGSGVTRGEGLDEERPPRHP